MSNHGLIDRILSARRSRVELQPGVFAVVQRPAEGELVDFWKALQGTGDIPALMRWIVGWEGVTEGILLGDGSASPVPWSAEVAQVAFIDRLEWVGAIMEEISRLVEQQRLRREAALGKPSGSSTSPSIESGPTTTDPSPALPTS